MPYHVASGALRIGTDRGVRRFDFACGECLKGAAMPRAASSKIDKIEHPQSHYATPDELIEDRALSFEEKRNALKIWEQDARQMLTASNEGMAGREEGIDPSNHHMLGQVERAKDKLQRSAKPPVSRRRG